MENTHILIDKDTGNCECIAKTTGKQCRNSKLKGKKYCRVHLERGCNPTLLTDLPVELIMSISHSLNDFELHNFCKSDEKFEEMCKNPRFWRTRLIKKYPYYSEAIIKAFGEDPPMNREIIDKTYVKLITAFGGVTVGSKLSHQEVMKRLGQQGDLELIEQKARNKGDYNDAMMGAAYGGHMNLVKYFEKEKGAGNRLYYRLAMVGAAQGGHLDVVKYLAKKKGVVDRRLYDDATKWAIFGGHLDVVKYLKHFNH
jgi:hypothetical protein